MRVCVITPVLDAYKGGNHLPLLAACRDTEFTIVCNRSRLAEKDVPSNVTIVTVQGRIGSYYYGVLDFLFAKHILKKFPPKNDFWKQFAVIHINQTMGPALKKLKSCGVPLLFLIHHPVTADREIAMTESKGFSVMQWWLKYFALVRWQRKMCAVADRVVAVSHTMRDRIANDYHCAEANISVVLNGVDGGVFTPVADSDCHIDIVALGSFIHPRKGFPYLLDVYRTLAQSGKKIADVGRRSNEQRKALQEIEGVEVLGTVDSDRLVDTVRHARVLISTSLFEGFGLSLIEALACGHPAFAFAVGAVPEVLGEIDSNLVVPPRDTGQMLKRVDQYLSLSSAQRDANGVRYRQKVLSRYSLESSADSLQSVYKQMAS